VPKVKTRAQTAATPKKEEEVPEAGEASPTPNEEESGKEESDQQQKKARTDRSEDARSEATGSASEAGISERERGILEEILTTSTDPASALMKVAILFGIEPSESLKE
jgi:hypothetical protein